MLTAVTFGEVKSLMDFEIFDDEEEEEEEDKKKSDWGSLQEAKRRIGDEKQLLIIKSSIM